VSVSTLSVVPVSSPVAPDELLHLRDDVLEVGGVDGLEEDRRLPRVV
jgi:hypothetical protein